MPHWGGTCLGGMLRSVLGHKHVILHRQGDKLSVSIQGASGRNVVFEGDNIGCPDSVFMSGPGGMCYEFPRKAFLSAIKHEFDLYDGVDISISELLAAA